MKQTIQIVNNNLCTLNTEFLNYQHTQKRKPTFFFALYRQQVHLKTLSYNFLLFSVVNH